MAATTTFGADLPQDRLQLSDDVAIELVRIPAGEFRMGSPENEAGRSNDEVAHRVRISRPFWIGVHEVTQRQYTAVTDSNPSYFIGEANLPVERVSWEAAVQFCRRASEVTRRAVRLPSEAQWEYACRAGTTSAFSSGDGVGPDAANFDVSQGGAIPVEPLERTTPVGHYGPNPWGLYDMHGNVREWCSDWYAPYPSHDRDFVDPMGPAEGTAHVLRGGSWDDYSRRCRSAFRHGYRPGDREQCNGFRIVVLVDPTDE
ncbi:MAG: formylglycine-generating enzyme family protein [Pirellulales bacterium]